PDLDELLVAPVHVAHGGLAGQDLLAVELDDDAQRAVGGRVLRTHVEGHALLGLELQVHPAVGGLGVGVGQLLAIGDGGHSLASPSVSASAAGAASSGMGST